jgi:Matrixin
VKKLRPLQVEYLEDRSTPATTGVTWPDGMHLTLSFVPDGTAVDGYTSELFSTLKAIAPTATWEREILRAFQTWAQYTNINIGLVADTGDPLGSPGAVQADAAFGDIRVAAVPLPAGTLATNTSFQWSGTTWSGDVLINSNYLFSVDHRPATYDLFTVVLNEAGNVFGLADSTTDTTSAMYHQYTGPRNGIGTADRSAIQALYGVRSADEFDTAKPNNKFDSASNLGTAPSRLNREADITANGDVDTYRFTPPTDKPIVAFTVQVTTGGLSSLIPKVEVYNSSLQLVGADLAYDPFKGMLTVRIDRPKLGSVYYVKVTNNANPPFGVGSYRLSVTYHYADGTTNCLQSTAPVPVSDNHTNDAITTATNIPPRRGNLLDARFDYMYRGVICDSTDMDYYKVQSLSVTDQKLNVLVWSLDGRLVPKIEVYDATYKPVAYQLLGNEDGTFSVEILNVIPGANYFIKLAATYPTGSRGTGAYFMGVDFSTKSPTSMQSYAAGTLTAAAPKQVSVLRVGQNSLFEFILSPDAGLAGAWTQVAMDIYDDTGKLVFRLLAYSGELASTGHVYLEAGTYTVRYSAAAPPGGPLGPVAYSLTGQLISGPIGPQTSDGSSSGTPTTVSPPSTDTSSASGTTWTSPYYF